VILLPAASRPAIKTQTLCLCGSMIGFFRAGVPFDVCIGPVSRTSPHGDENE
jgi:hypothetical protein